VLERALIWLRDEQLMEDRPAADGRVRWRRRADPDALQQRLRALRVASGGSTCP
jgi:hypothetical protein